MRDSKNQEKTIVVRKTGTDEYSLVKISNGDVHEFEERGIGDVRMVPWS